MLRPAPRARLIVTLLVAATPACKGGEAAMGPAPTPTPALTPSYEVPPAPARVAAIGDVSKLTHLLKRAFDPEGGSFEPMDEPRAGDWLAVHPEPGQTFDEYVVALPNQPDRARHVLVFLPIGPFAPDRSPDLGQLAAFARAFFGLDVRLAEGVATESLGVTSRLNRSPRVRQLRAPDLLDALGRRLPDDAYALIGVTMEDLYPEESWNFVFGMASLRERVGVYSFTRFDPAFSGMERGAGWRKRMLQRSVALMAHEVGHMFGIRHCVYFQCVMNGSNSLAESDRRPPHLCPMCLRKLHHVTGLDIVARYQRLATWYEEAGIDAEAHWLRRRLAYLQGN